MRTEWLSDGATDGVCVFRRGTTVDVELWYPRIDDGRVQYVVVGLSDVRCADDVRLSYDFERNGWKVEQASVFEWDVDDPNQDPQWVEVAFVPAWGSQRVPPREP